MSENLRKNISALMDNELVDKSIDSLLSEVSNDKSAAQLWERYHLAKDILSDDMTSVNLKGFSARISDAITDEPTVFSPQSHHKKPVTRSLKNVFSFSDFSSFKPRAIAASVLAVGLLTLFSINQSNLTDQSVASAPSASVNESIKASLNEEVYEKPERNLKPAPVLVAIERDDDLESVEQVPVRLRSLVTQHQRRVWSQGQSVSPRPYATVVRY